MQIDTFGAYVRAELEHWGREFALHRDYDYLGHHSKNILQVLIDHKGDMPGRAQGFKPLESDARAQRVEDLVAAIARDSPAMACVLRGYYCGLGRRKVERFEQANALLARSGLRQLSLASYSTYHEMGFQRLRGVLEGMARTA